jgi:hypothetical protein
MAQPTDNEKWWTAPTPTTTEKPKEPAYVSPLMAMILQQQQAPTIVAKPPPVQYAPTYTPPKPAPAPAPKPTVMQQINAPAPPPTNTTPYTGGTYAPKNYYTTATPFSTGQAPYSGQGTYVPQTSPPPPATRPLPLGVDQFKAYTNPTVAPVPYSEWYRSMYGGQPIDKKQPTQAGAWTMAPGSAQEARSYQYNPPAPYQAPSEWQTKPTPPDLSYRNWEDSYDQFGMPNRPYAVVKPPPTAGTAPTYPGWNTSGNGYGWNSGGGGGGGGGGYGDYASQARWWLNPGVWRI